MRKDHGPCIAIDEIVSVQRDDDRIEVTIRTGPDYRCYLVKRTDALHGLALLAPILEDLLGGGGEVVPFRPHAAASAS